ncbi:MAG: glycosyltransferase, partial [Deltaproteobacteria bacterium]|nr:glycosyltransferase [Deltaproteobacteria bacterium]
MDLTEKLRRKEAHIRLLQEELEKIYRARFWKIIRTYARLKSFLKMRPETAFRKVLNQVQIVGPVNLARHALTHVKGTAIAGNSHPGPLNLPTPPIYERWLSLNRPQLETLLLQRQEVLTWKDRPLISLIIPVYNTNASWLQSLLCSVSDQTYDHWETLLVDDHSSSPDTVAILKHQVNRDSRFKLIERVVNGGISAACQEGLQAASGLFA